MLKTVLVLCAALPLLAFSPQDAKADVDVDLYLGAPGFYVGPGDRRYYRDRYDDRRYYRDRWDRPRYYGRISCGEARRIVRNSGYRNVSARDCSGRTYSFNATRRGDRVRIFVNARTGAIWR